ncbi:unnamed protein product [Rotaria magnacalcarata]|uniref:Uncharacterized protein n=3 Tax=Rotaria magnacalcarata TaxID=392030 RepID=A0A816Z0I8_9BILA|nr:unnamed protein product [Rotaria magnacalcarata]
MTTAVRHFMECHYQKFDASKLPKITSAGKASIKDPLETILELTHLMNLTENESDEENDDISMLIASFIKNPESVLQELDIQRLRAVIYRDVVRPDRNLNSDDHTDATNINEPAMINTQRNADASIVVDDTNNESNKEDSQSTDQDSVDLNGTRATTAQLANFNTTESSSAMNITEKLERALSNIAPFLREIFTEFSHILTKTLIGSHDQELLPSGLNALKQTASVVELVMLLCSQEWQNSLHKHAGLAFMELANEGRLLTHASKDHVVKVASEANFILNRMRADDIRKASEFEQLSAQTAVERKGAEQLCEHFITTARQRHQAIASRIQEKCLAMMISDKAAYLNSSRSFWKLDTWKDDLRRRRPLVRNPNGSIHNEATQKSSSNGIRDGLITSVIQEENLLKQIKRQKGQNFKQTTNEDDGKSFDQDFSEPIRFSAERSLICDISFTHGTLAMTRNAMLFDANEYDETFSKINSKMFPYVENIHGKWHFNEIREIFSRRYLLQDKALKIFVSNRKPFTTFYFNLQEGKFDHASRTFHSIPISWQNCQWDSFDVKELIPESFSLPEMFTNCNHYKLGRVEDGIKIDDVV